MKTAQAKKNLIISLILSLLLISSACNTSSTLKGGAIGATGGGAIGALVGNATGNTALGAIIGAAVGGTAGTLIGRYMDKQAAELDADLEGTTVERVGEGIKITFDSGILFAVNSSQLSDKSKANLEELATTLNKYPDTDILIEGHTDNSGSDELNQKLSEKRATSVAAYLIALTVSTERVTTSGYGELQPISDNTTVKGREKNRRVEIAISANKKLKRAAKRGDRIVD